MSPGPVCGEADSLHPLVTLPVSTIQFIQLNTELRSVPSKQRTAIKVSVNDFVSRVNCGAAEDADLRSIKKRLVVGLMSWPRQ